MNYKLGFNYDSIFKEAPLIIQQRAKLVVVKHLNLAREKAYEYAPKLTGATATAIHVVHESQDDYEIATTKSSNLNPKIEFFMPEDPPVGGTEGYLYSPAVHSYVLEFGGGRGNRPARPFLTPAIAEQSDEFFLDMNAELADAFAKLAKSTPNRRTRRRG